ncbi:hypothetical protein LSH36_1776g00006 [Paralvinella palmiformis]|uniref:SUEL-type lectin domain-containing protein n=1 Tax=Paralvinella palmiformis TaxID=53620 RepID=A0AAD9IRR3_9ANNE|nr:hypothetical protein LSH36_1776g00006 [Paralvinella palmiformis]
MRIGKCVQNDLGYLGCQNDVLNLADLWCSGLQHCTVEVTNDELDQANTACIADLNSYLEVDYSCVPVFQPVSDCLSSSVISVHIAEGHISSHVTTETGCGSPRAPWVIEAQSGQTIDLWLIDFGALDREEQSLYTSCHQLYGFIIERDLGVNLTMCGGTERKRHLYKSKTNKVEVHMLSLSGSALPRFLVHYKSIGCANLLPPAHAWYKRDNNEAVIGCKSDDRIWHLYCTGNTWDGVVGNCSKAVIILTSLVCGALLIIIIVIVAGSVYIKKQRIRHEIKLRSDYGIVPEATYYTMKSGYNVDTLRMSTVPHLADSQPLVNIVDKGATDVNSSQNDDRCTTMLKSSCHHELQEVCDGQELLAECQGDMDLLVQSAVLGRMRLGKCVLNDFGYIGCKNDVLNLADRWCSGLSQCNFLISNNEFKKANVACAADLSLYLEIVYMCVPVIKPHTRCSSKTYTTIRTNEGQLSSHVTAETGCGSPRAPWVIEAQSGQTIDLWLIDFGALDREEEQSLYTSCHQLYGFIIERDLGVNLTMCGGTERKRHLYKSKTNKVEVHMLSYNADLGPRYFVQYSLVGCPDLIPPAHAWYKRDGTEAMIGCNQNDRVWHLKCIGNTWNGVVGNCTGTGISEQEINNNLDSFSSEFGVNSQAMYYTIKSGYDVGTIRSAQAQIARDIQPLVPCVDQDTKETNATRSDISNNDDDDSDDIDNSDDCGNDNNYEDLGDVDNTNDDDDDDDDNNNNDDCGDDDNKDDYGDDDNNNNDDRGDDNNNNDDCTDDDRKNTSSLC